MMSKIKFRAEVNAVSKKMRKKIKEAIRSFVWEGSKKSKVSWAVLTRKEDEGGIRQRPRLLY